MKLSKYVTTLGVTITLITAQMFGLPNSKPQKAQAHCAWNHPHHCELEDFDPTKLIPGSAEVVEEAWGEAGRGLYSAAAEFMSIDNNHIPRQSLDSRQKELLRPEFGSLVERVTVQYGADMMDRWGSGKFQISQGSAGQTFCNEIYIQAPYTENDYSQLILLAHELQHSRQCENLGGMSNFGYRYFKEYKKAGQSYENNSLEREAETVAGKVEQYVASQRSQPVASQDRFRSGFYSHVGMNPPGIIYRWPSPWNGGTTDVWCDVPNHNMYVRHINNIGSAIEINDLDSVQNTANYWSKPCTDDVFEHPRVQH